MKKIFLGVSIASIAVLAAFLVVTFEITRVKSLRENVQEVSLSSTRPNRCEDVFRSDAIRVAQPNTARLVPTNYMWTRVLEQRVGPIVGGRIPVLVTYQFPMTVDGSSQVSLISRVEYRSAPADLRVESIPNRTDTWEEASAAVNFVIETYRERRPHWTPEFLSKLRAMAFKNLHESTYITIRGGLGYRSSSPFATIRLIREKAGFLPMENHLGIEIDVGNRLKVEPGNFAIDKSMSQEAWAELLIQLLSTTAREIEAGRENHYLTYADRYSLALYSQLGFAPVDPSKIKLKPGTVMKDGKIFANDVWWTPMEASQATLDGLLRLHGERLRRRGFDPNIAENLLARQQNLNRSRESIGREIQGHGSINGKFQGGRLEIKQAGEYTRLMFRPDDLSQVSLIATIESRLPLDQNPIRLSGSGRATYENGRLLIERGDGTYGSRIEILTDANLSFVISLKVHQLSEDGQSHEIDFRF